MQTYQCKDVADARRFMADCKKRGAYFLYDQMDMIVYHWRVGDEPRS